MVDIIMVSLFVCRVKPFLLKNLVDYGILYKIADYRYQEYEINFILRTKDFKKKPGRKLLNEKEQTEVLGQNKVSIR